MKPPITRDQFDAVLLDLDGVITDTASIHATTWKQMLDAYLQKRAAERGEPFRPCGWETAIYGVRDFLASRNIDVLEGTADDPPVAETVGRLLGTERTL